MNKSIYKDIINNRNLQDNIPKFLDMAIGNYNTYASVRLALYYYTYYEQYLDEKESWTGCLHEYIEAINNVISKAILQVSSQEELVEYIKQIDDIRKGITKKMEMLTQYVDLFEIYEYALNRVEYRFKQMDQMEEDEELARDLLRYIFESEDNVMINERIKEIIGQLPVRITKQKYFDYLRDSLYGLIGANEDVLNTHIYMIKSCAMLDVSSEMKDAFPMLWKKKEKLEKIDFKEITEEEYNAATLLIRESVSFLENESSVYFALIEIVNELYSLLLCAPYIEAASSDSNDHTEAAIHIINSINSAFLGDNQDEPSTDLLASFSTIEGIQEAMEYDIISLEDMLYHIEGHHGTLVDNHEKMQLLQALLLIKDLHSSSLFIELNRTDPDGVIDQEMLKKEIDKISIELEDRFRGIDRMIVRGIMANTMSRMPVFFNSHSEVMEYVLYSLDKCTDLAEKYASIEIIKSLME